MNHQPGQSSGRRATTIEDRPQRPGPRAASAQNRAGIVGRLPLRAPEDTPTPELVAPRRSQPPGALVMPPVPAAQPPVAPPPRMALGSTSGIGVVEPAVPDVRRRGGSRRLVAVIALVGVVAGAAFLATSDLVGGSGDGAVAAAGRASVETDVAAADTPEPAGITPVAPAAAVDPAADPASTPEPAVAEAAPAEETGTAAESAPPEEAETADKTTPPAAAAAAPEPERAAGSRSAERDSRHAARERAAHQARSSRSARHERRSRADRAARRHAAAHHAAPAPAKPAAPSAEPGFLTVDATPYATIYIDGVRAGDTPLIRRSIPAGDHDIKAVSSTGAVKQFHISVQSGQAVRRRIKASD
jgi:hypothetical protein